MPQPEIRRIIWQGGEIEISFTANWLGGLAHHLELRCDRVLPVTQTGYRSRFLSADLSLTMDEVEETVLEWLDGAAQDKAWRRADEIERQGDLFDL